MVEITDNAWTVAKDILKELRDEVKTAREWLEIVKTDHAYKGYQRAQEKLEGAERIARQIGLDC